MTTPPRSPLKPRHCQQRDNVAKYLGTTRCLYRQPGHGELQITFPRGQLTHVPVRMNAHLTWATCLLFLHLESLETGHAQSNMAHRLVALTPVRRPLQRYTHITASADAYRSAQQRKGKDADVGAVPTDRHIAKAWSRDAR